MRHEQLIKANNERFKSENVEILTNFYKIIMCDEPRKHLDYLSVRKLYNEVFDFDQLEYEILLWQT